MKHFQEVSQVGFSLLVDTTWILLGNVSCVSTQNQSDTDLQIDPNSIPYTGLTGN